MTGQRGFGWWTPILLDPFWGTSGHTAKNIRHDWCPCDSGLLASVCRCVPDSLGRVDRCMSDKPEHTRA